MRTEGDHHQVSENVYHNLPEWQQAEWREVLEPFLKVYSFYPDLLAPVNGEERCEATEPRHREFMYVDGVFCQAAFDHGTWRYAPLVRHSNEGGGDCILAWEPFRKVFAHYLERTASALAARDHTSAAKYAGIVSHILCDRTPGDHIDPAIWIGLLFPPPEDCDSPLDPNWGFATKEVDIPRLRYRPRLLGSDVPEAVHGFYQRYLHMMKEGIPYVSRMLSAAYAGRFDDSKRLLSEVRLLGIEIISDFLHTAFCLGYGRFDPDELQQLGTADLTRWFASVNEMDWLYFRGPYTDGFPRFFSEGRSPIPPRKAPAELLVPRAGGDPELRTVTPCLAVLPDSGCQIPERWAKLVYDLPESARYRRFACLAGMPPHGSVRGETRGRVRAQVLGDDTVLWEQAQVVGGEPATALDLDITGCRRLTLLVTGLHRMSDEFWLGHFIWGQPRLIK